MKILLYCTKAKPYLYKHFVLADDDKDTGYTYETSYSIDEFKNEDPTILNGTIPCECDYEVEDIYYGYEIDDFWTKTCGSQKDIKHNLLKQSCLTDDEMHYYLQPKDSYYGDCGKAIHIKNLHIFDEPKQLSDYYQYTIKGIPNTPAINVQKAPQNIMRVFSWCGDDYILISIRPELMCKILNGECSIIIKKKVLKEMLKENEK